MTRNRWIVIAAIGVLMLGVYAFARKGEPVNTNAAVENKALTASPTPAAAAANALEASATDNKFYGVDYEAGLRAGKEAGLAGATELVTTERPAYNDGYKAGLQEGIKEKNSPRPTTVVRRSGGRTVVYRNAGTTTTARKKNSTLKTVLQIAAPAAIGAGIGAAAGGGKGAAAGAAIGGGAGAIYTIIKNKN